MITWHEQWPNWSWKRKKGQVKKNYLHVLDKQRENGINTFKIPEIKENEENWRNQTDKSNDSSKILCR